MAIRINGATVISDAQAITSTSTISATGNVTAGNIITNGSVTINNVTLAASGTNLSIGGNTVVTANATGTSSTTGNVTISGTVTGGNIATAGTVSATGNITGSYILGNGSQLTGISVTPTQIYNGTSNVTIPSTNGNVAINVGSKNWTFDSTGNVTVPSSQWIQTPVGSNGNINFHPDGTGQLNIQGGSSGALVFINSDTANSQNRIEVDNFGNSSEIGGTFTGRFARGTAATPAAVQSDDQLAAFKGRGYDGTGYQTPTGLITVEAGANWSTGNLPTRLTFWTTPTGTSTPVESVRISSNGNLSVFNGNILTAGYVSATGNVTGSYILGNGSQLTGVTATGVGTLSSLSVTGNITSGNISATNHTGTNVSVTGTVTAASTVGGVITGTSTSVTGTQTAASTVGGVITGTSTSVTGTQTAASTVGGVITGTSTSVTGTTTAASVVGGVITGTSASVTGAVTGASLVGTITTASQTNITSVGTLGALSVIGTATAGNLATGGTVSATGNVNGGNVIGTTAVVVPTVRNTAALTISTSSGAINLQPTSNVVVNSTYINGVLNPVQNQDVATKAYVDNFATAGISFHSPVAATTNTTLATATGGTITYTQPNGAGNGVGALLTTTGAFNLIDTSNVQTVGTRILVKNEANAVYNGVYTWANATNIVRSTDTDEYGADSVEALSVNDYFFTTGGNVNAGAAFVVNAPTGTITFGTSNITFATFSTSQTYTANTSAGVSLNGTVINGKVDGTTIAFDGGGNISVKASATLTTPNIGAATGTSLSVTGAVTAASTVGGVITGSSASVTGAVTGASLVGTITTASQTNITSVGTLSSLSVTGNTTSGNISATNHTGTNVSVTGTVTAASTVGGVITGSSASVTGAVTAASTVGGVITGSSASVTGAVTAASTVGGVITGSSASVTGAVTGASLVGTITTASQTNITSVGTLSSLSVTGNVTAGNLSVGTGTITGGNIVNSNANGVGNIGSATTYFNTVFAKATSAQYADLAEKYTADAAYAPGTVVVFGGQAEVTVNAANGDTKVAGVVSTNPSYIMNGTLEAEHVATVALTGRVPCMVLGSVKKGDLMVAAGLGRARAEADPRVGSVIGKALEDFDGAEGTIEVVVGRF